MKARRIIHEKTVNADGTMVEIRVTEVPKSEAFPEGCKYSFVYIDADGNRVLGYDNSKKQGPHRHFKGSYEKVDFHSIEALIDHFQDEVKSLRGEK